MQPIVSQKGEDKSMSGSSSPSLEEQGQGSDDLEEQEEDEGQEEDGDNFGDWMQLVSRCLKSRLTEEDTKANEKEKDEEDEEEEERSMRIVRSVIDEETVLDMAKHFIKLTKVNSALYEPLLVTKMQTYQTPINQASFDHVKVGPMPILAFHNL